MAFVCVLVIDLCNLEQKLQLHSITDQPSLQTPQLTFKSIMPKGCPLSTDAQNWLQLEMGMGLLDIELPISFLTQPGQVSNLPVAFL